jgi:hypothetical protein
MLKPQNQRYARRTVSLRPWDAENLLIGYLKLQAAQAKQKAA